MSQLFGVRVDTAYRICSLRKYQVKKRGGSRGKKLNDEHIQFLLEKIESFDIVLPQFGATTLLPKDSEFPNVAI